ncbi:hypothetical protein HDU98_003259 [Podochytrium sp. JEL0797]|nr:hypothetical protein HDU98_003259 [Podochytrium sp. JEL0797]
MTSFEYFYRLVDATLTPLLGTTTDILVHVSPSPPLGFEIRRTIFEANQVLLPGRVASQLTLLGPDGNVLRLGAVVPINSTTEDSPLVAVLFWVGANGLTSAPRPTSTPVLKNAVVPVTPSVPSRTSFANTPLQATEVVKPVKRGWTQTPPPPPVFAPLPATPSFPTPRDLHSPTPAPLGETPQIPPPVFALPAAAPPMFPATPSFPTSRDSVTPTPAPILKVPQIPPPVFATPTSIPTPLPNTPVATATPSTPFRAPFANAPLKSTKDVNPVQRGPETIDRAKVWAPPLPVVAVRAVPPFPTPRDFNAPKSVPNGEVPQTRPPIVALPAIPPLDPRDSDTSKAAPIVDIRNAPKAGKSEKKGRSDMSVEVDYIEMASEGIVNLDDGKEFLGGFEEGFTLDEDERSEESPVVHTDGEFEEGKGVGPAVVPEGWSEMVEEQAWHEQDALESRIEKREADEGALDWGHYAQLDQDATRFENGETLNSASVSSFATDASEFELSRTETLDPITRTSDSWSIFPPVFPVPELETHADNVPEQPPQRGKKPQTARESNHPVLRSGKEFPPLSQSLPVKIQEPQVVVETGGEPVGQRDVIVQDTADDEDMGEAWD